MSTPTRLSSEWSLSILIEWLSRLLGDVNRGGGGELPLTRKSSVRSNEQPTKHHLRPAVRGRARPRDRGRGITWRSTKRGGGDHNLTLKAISVVSNYRLHVLSPFLLPCLSLYELPTLDSLLPTVLPPGGCFFHYVPLLIAGQAKLKGKAPAATMEEKEISLSIASWHFYVATVSPPPPSSSRCLLHILQLLLLLLLLLHRAV